MQAVQPVGDASLAINNLDLKRSKRICRRECHGELRNRDTRCLSDRRGMEGRVQGLAGCRRQELRAWFSRSADNRFEAGIWRARVLCRLAVVSQPRDRSKATSPLGANLMMCRRCTYDAAYALLAMVMADALPAAALQRCRWRSRRYQHRGQYTVWSVQEGSAATLDALLSTLAWPQVTMILVVILCAVLIGVWISARVRHPII